MIKRRNDMLIWETKEDLNELCQKRTAIVKKNNDEYLKAINELLMSYEEEGKNDGIFNKD